MGHDLSHGMTLGPFTVDRRGLLSPASPESFPAFAVRWRDLLVRARMVRLDAGSGTGTLEFSTRLGRVPSTAGPDTTGSASRPVRRGAVLAMLRGLPSLVPPLWRLRLSADHTVLMEATAPLTLPVSATALVTEITLFLLALAPYLEVMDTEGVDFTGPSLAGTALPAAGMAKT